MSTKKKKWDALLKKYDIKEAGSEKYVVSWYLKFQMANDQSIELQSHELQKIAHEIISKGIVIDEEFWVVFLIDKLSPLKKDFKTCKAQDQRIFFGKSGNTLEDWRGGSKIKPERKDEHHS